MNTESPPANYAVISTGGYQIAWFVSKRDAQDFILSQPFPETYIIRLLDLEVRPL